MIDMRKNTVNQYAAPGYSAVTVQCIMYDVSTTPVQHTSPAVLS